MDVSLVLACVASVITTSLLSEYIACDNDVDAIADIIQGRAVAWVVQLETMLQLCKPWTKKPSRVSGYVIGIAKQIMKIQKEHQSGSLEVCYKHCKQEGFLLILVTDVPWLEFGWLSSFWRYLRPKAVQLWMECHPREYGLLWSAMASLPLHCQCHMPGVASL